MVRGCLLAVGLALTMMEAVVISDAAAPPSPLVPGSGLVAGRGYDQWVVAANRWRISLPGVTSNRTSCLTAQQQGPVWFLNESNSNAPAITITCTTPAGRYVMLFVPAELCSTIDFPGTTNAGLMRCAKRGWRRAPGAETLTLDGTRLDPAGYVSGTRAFSFKMPAQNNWLERPGKTHGRMAVYGAATIFQPLGAGTHTLVQMVRFGHSATYTTTYQLTVS